MTVFVYVEGPSDVLALKELFRGYMQELRPRKHSLSFLSLKNKSNLLKKIGPRAAEKLVQNPNDRVVALPDLYPSRTYATTQYAHSDLGQLRERLRDLVKAALQAAPYRVRPPALDGAMARFYACALKHDLEMLLLSAWPSLQRHMGARLNPEKDWRQPAEDQDEDRPPKRVVEGLFKARAGRDYHETKDARVVLGRVARIRDDLLYTTQPGQLECPVFKGLLDWIGEQTGVAPY